MININNKYVSFFEILTIVIAIFAFAYIISDTNDYFQGSIEEESKFIKKSREVLLDWLSGGLVSAQLWTCLENVNGTICQEYPSNTCDENCVEPCLPGPREDFEICKLGTCLDPEQGTCSANTPKAVCENSGGEWSEQPPGQCNLGRCIIGDGTQTQYTTEITCNVISQGTGVETEWQSVANEIECLLLAGQQDVGACVFETDFENNCQFTTQAACSEIGGEFHIDLLCTNPDLETICEITEDTTCVEGKDEVHFVDSCGNVANIYDWTKKNNVNYWSVKVAKENSCSLQSGNNPLAKQKTCGNCVYLLGSICGTPGPNDKNPNIGEFVCKDLSCTDEWENNRKNGESWCAFDGRIGLDNENQANTERSVDVPGSRHYRRVCLDGEVRTDPCADFRNEICVENRDESISFSSAACRINQWQVCISANTDVNKLDNCEKNTDCSLHKVDFDTYFKFDMCTPKYPPGFDLQTSGGAEIGEGICSLASQTCTLIEVKKFSGWKCEVNCHCREVGFTETMNNLCLSLGDCGGSVNVAGKYTGDGYSVKRAPRLNSGYKSGLKKYGDVKKNQFVEPLTGKELAALFGIPEATFENEAEFAEFIGKLGLGATGVLFSIGFIKTGYAGFAAAIKADGIISTVFGTVGEGSAAIPGIQSFAGVASGALVGAAIGYLIGKAFGLQGEALDLTTIAGALAGLASAFIGGSVGVGSTIAGGSSILVGASGIAGTVGGAGGGITIIAGPGGATIGGVAVPAGGASAVGAGTTFTATAGSTITSAGGGIGTITAGGGTVTGGASFAAIIGPVIIIVLLIALLFLLLGIGDTREIQIEFTCSTWQPPTGGSNCDKCGNDPARPCSRYKCQSLGQTCKLINEGTGEELCIDISPNDASAPIINPYYDLIGAGFEYTNIQNNGFEIKSTETDDGCIKAFTPVLFGVSLNEPGQCKVEVIHTNSYGDMSNFFGESNLYKYDHITTSIIPSLVSLGVPGFGPDLRGDYNLYVRCQDGSGNANVQEYVIEFCVSPADDVTAPIITEFIPPSPGYAGLNISEKFVQFYTNEPADCKWSLEDKDYELMENIVLCNNEANNTIPNGLLCNTNLPVGEEDEMNYYFRCADQPWLLHDDDEENDDDGNINTESTIYIIIKTTEELIISSISPNNETIFAGGVPVIVDLEVHTEGGVDGTALCEFSFDADSGIFINFFETGGNVHKQTFSTLFEGNYNIALQCTDVAENVATGTSVFTIEVDDVGPLITSIYNLNGILNVITNEPSQCAFTHESCAFNFDDGELMSGSGLTHTTSFEQGLTYYIKCRDDFGNVGMCLSVTGGY